MAEEIKPAPSPAPAESASQGKQGDVKAIEGQAPKEGTKPGQPQGNPLMDMLPMLAGMMIIFYLLLIRPENKRRKQQQAMLGAMKKNDKVVLAAIGMYGTVTDIEGDDVTIQIDPKKDVRITVRKEAIGAVVNDVKK